MDALIWDAWMDTLKEVVRWRHSVGVVGGMR